MYEFAVTPAVTQIRRRGVTITEVEPGSLGEELELEPGDRVVKVNGRVVRDYLDFRFHTGGETELTLDVLKRGGEEWEVEVERGEGEDFGLQFENIAPRQCANECLFCFCKGNPPDARPALFFRDEDVRLSFLYGNYTTLSSITEDEMARVIEQRLTPQYVSVHATDLKVRAYLLGVDEQPRRHLRQDAPDDGRRHRDSRAGRALPRHQRRRSFEQDGRRSGRRVPARAQRRHRPAGAHALQHGRASDAGHARVVPRRSSARSASCRKS